MSAAQPKLLDYVFEFESKNLIYYLRRGQKYLSTVIQLSKDLHSISIAYSFIPRFRIPSCFEELVLVALVWSIQN